MGREKPKVHRNKKRAAGGKPPKFISANSVGLKKKAKEILPNNRVIISSSCHPEVKPQRISYASSRNQKRELNEGLEVLAGSSLPDKKERMRIKGNLKRDRKLASRYAKQQLLTPIPDEVPLPNLDPLSLSMQYPTNVMQPGQDQIPDDAVSLRSYRSEGVGSIAPMVQPGPGFANDVYSSDIIEVLSNSDDEIIEILDYDV